MEIEFNETNKSLSSIVYENILTKLITGVYSPGDMINRKIIAEELKVSLAPISEAIMLLEYEGFLVKYPRQGTLVRKARWKDLKNQLILCNVLSCAAIEFINNEKLLESIPELRVLAEKADLYDLPWAERWHSEIDFHTALVSLTNNKAMTSCFKNEFQLYQFYKSHLIVFGNTEIHEKHTKLVDVISTMKVNEAKKAMENHFKKGIEMMLEN